MRMSWSCLVVAKYFLGHTFFMLIVESCLEILNLLTEITLQTPTIIMTTRIWNLNEEREERQWKRSNEFVLEPYWKIEWSFLRFVFVVLCFPEVKKIGANELHERRGIYFGIILCHPSVHFFPLLSPGFFFSDTFNPNLC